MLLRTGTQKTKISDINRDDQYDNATINAFSKLPRMPIEVYMDWSGAIKPYIQAGVLQGLISRIIPPLLNVAGQDIPFHLLTHKVTTLPALNFTNCKNYIPEFVLPAGVAMGLPDLSLITPVGEDPQHIVLLSDGQIRRTNMEQIIETYSNVMFLTIITMPAQVNAALSKLDACNNVFITHIRQGRYMSVITYVTDLVRKHKEWYENV